MTAVDVGMPSAAVEPGELPDHLSVAQMQSWSQCGTRYYLERIERAPQRPAWWSIGGGAIHTALQMAVRDDLDADEAVTVFLGDFAARCAAGLLVEPDVSLWKAGGRASKANPNKEDGDWWIVNGADQVRRFVAVQDTAFLPGKVVRRTSGEHIDPRDGLGEPLVEVPFEVQIGERMVKGVIDAVVDLRTSIRGTSFVPRDYKSGANAPKSALQLAVYAEAMRQLFNVTPSTGQYLMTRKLATGDAVISYDLAGLGHDVLARMFDGFAKARDIGLFLPNPSNLCPSCSVQSSCPFGQGPLRS